jgi:hypothetical protein
MVNTLERKSADACVAFTGLNTRPDESGQHHGKRCLSKRGPSELRRLLYLAALSAIKTKNWGQSMSTIGEKDYPVLRLSSSRRIALTVWSMYTYKTDFDPGRLMKG